MISADILEPASFPAEAAQSELGGRIGENVFSDRRMAYACVVRSTVPSGRIERLDAMKTLAVEGVLAVLTHENAPRLQWPIPMPSYTDFGDQWLPLQDDRIHFRGQCVGMVIADTLAGAQEGADRMVVEARPAVFDFAAIDRTYRSLYLNYDPLEARVTVADWTPAGLVLQETAPWVPELRTAVALATGWPEKKVEVQPLAGEEEITGTAHFAWPQSVLAAMASRQVERPVKLLA